MRNKNVAILAVAAVVLLVAAYILSRTSAEASTSTDAGPSQLPTKSTKAKVEFPRDKIAKAKANPQAPPPPPPQSTPQLDAMQRALLGPNSKGAVFVEANAIRHSPLMEKILRCREKESADGLSQMKNELGIDPMEDVDRVGFDGDVFVASGFFEKLKVPAEVGEGKAYGDKSHIWETTDDGGQKLFFGKTGDGLMMSGIDEATLKGAMDRAEGRGVSSTLPSALPPGFGEGEVYGTVGAAFLQSILGDANDPVAQQIAKLVTQGTVRMNVDEDAALSLDLQAVDESAAKDLSSAVGGVLSGLHAKAQQEGDADLAALLEQARVAPQGDGKFNVDVAVPGDTLLRGMGCKPDGTRLAPTLGPRKPATLPPGPAMGTGDLPPAPRLQEPTTLPMPHR